jgi:hypothetical protein
VCELNTDPGENLVRASLLRRHGQLAHNVAAAVMGDKLNNLLLMPWLELNPAIEVENPVTVYDSLKRVCQKIGRESGTVLFGAVPMITSPFTIRPSRIVEEPKLRQAHTLKTLLMLVLCPALLLRK